MNEDSKCRDCDETEDLMYHNGRMYCLDCLIKRMDTDHE